MSLQRFFRIQLLAQVALLGCAVISAAISDIYAFARELGDGPSFGSMLGGVISMQMWGAIPVIVYGAPLYALAEAKRRATWPVVITIGALPGALLVALLPFYSHPGVNFLLMVATVVLGSGLIVASGTHLMCKKREGSVGAA